MRADEEYIRSMEFRIRAQRAQLRWWHENYEMKRLQPKARWKASQVCALLKRLGMPFRVHDTGMVSRPAEAKVR